MNNYQQQAARTLIQASEVKVSEEELLLVWCAVGLSGEAGEVMEAIKKGVFHKHGLQRDALVKELGDLCWYIAAICTTLGVDLDDVLRENIEKLRLRYPQGFSTKDSISRVDVDDIERVRDPNVPT